MFFSILAADPFWAVALPWKIGWKSAACEGLIRPVFMSERQSAGRNYRGGCQMSRKEVQTESQVAAKEKAISKTRNDNFISIRISISHSLSKACNTFSIYIFTVISISISPPINPIDIHLLVVPS